MKAAELQFSKPGIFSILFSDGNRKIFDFADSTGFAGIASELMDYAVFSSGRIASGGRRIEWLKNGAVFFDLCVDALRYFWNDASGEWKDVDPDLGLAERRYLIENKLKSA
jgi:hypothetical protein